jgi:hypothetical protein
VPYLGGVAIVVAFSLVILAADLFHPDGADTRALVVTLGLGVALAVMGLVDDPRACPCSSAWPWRSGPGWWSMPRGPWPIWPAPGSVWTPWSRWYGWSASRTPSTSWTT